MKTQRQGARGDVLGERQIVLCNRQNEELCKGQITLSSLDVKAWRTMRQGHRIVFASSIFIWKEGSCTLSES